MKKLNHNNLRENNLEICNGFTHTHTHTHAQIQENNFVHGKIIKLKIHEIGKYLQ